VAVAAAVNKTGVILHSKHMGFIIKYHKLTPNHSTFICDFSYIFHIFQPSQVAFAVYSDCQCFFFFFFSNFIVIYDLTRLYFTKYIDGYWTCEPDFCCIRSAGPRRIEWCYCHPATATFKATATAFCFSFIFFFFFFAAIMPLPLCISHSPS
jgi:hypothetical protein